MSRTTPARAAQWIRMTGAAGTPDDSLSSREGETRSALQPPAGTEHAPAGPGHGEGQDRAHQHADPDVALGLADEAVAEAVDHVEDRVEVADGRERLGQSVDEIEGAAEEGHRHDEKV